MTLEHESCWVKILIQLEATRIALVGPPVPLSPPSV